MKAFRFAMLAAGALLCAGCIRSKAVITSDPSEAMVWWNDTYRGRTPIEIPFIWYWKYKVDIEKEGYEHQTHTEFLRTRPWLIEPLQFLAEALPFRISDTRELHYTLKKKETP